MLALIGFSFTPTDLHVDSLFRLAISANSRLERIVIVNPSADHRRAIRSVVAAQLKRGVRIVQFDTLGEFAPRVAATVARRLVTTAALSVLLEPLRRALGPCKCQPSNGSLE